MSLPGYASHDMHDTHTVCTPHTPMHDHARQCTMWPVPLPFPDQAAQVLPWQLPRGSWGTTARCSSRRTQGAKGHQASAQHSPPSSAAVHRYARHPRESGVHRATPTGDLGSAAAKIWAPAARARHHQLREGVELLPRGSCRGSTCAASSGNKKEALDSDSWPGQTFRPLCHALRTGRSANARHHAAGGWWWPNRAGQVRGPSGYLTGMARDAPASMLRAGNYRPGARLEWRARRGIHLHSLTTPTPLTPFTTLTPLTPLTPCRVMAWWNARARGDACAHQSERAQQRGT